MYRIEILYVFIFFCSKVLFLKRVDIVLFWMDLSVNERFDFIILYFDEFDYAGYFYGFDDIVKVI